ncbi:hypothetical protein LEP1GSC132_3907 [Leptospira kirschneri str. 200803703]|nr:hypothetical protein LEP1GSC132_3907 [Leptospira kirschneri str. 200803703]
MKLRFHPYEESKFYFFLLLKRKVVKKTIYLKKFFILGFKATSL